jgi:hypothetical protein
MASTENWKPMPHRVCRFQSVMAHVAANNVVKASPATLGTASPSQCPSPLRVSP